MYEADTKRGLVRFTQERNKTVNLARDKAFFFVSKKGMNGHAAAFAAVFLLLGWE